MNRYSVFSSHSFKSHYSIASHIYYVVPLCSSIRWRSPVVSANGCALTPGCTASSPAWTNQSSEHQLTCSRKELEFWWETSTSLLIWHCLEYIKDTNYHYNILSKIIRWLEDLVQEKWNVTINDAKFQILLHSQWYKVSNEQNLNRTNGTVNSKWKEVSKWKVS